jgi:eukaryotic-like serine/threonine-protein kinase
MTPERFGQVSDLFHAALAREAATRAQFVEDACAGDLELRDEVMAWLTAHQEAGHFGQEPVRVLSPASIPLAQGTTLGPYRIEAPLGAGGMGEVYKATDARLERTVAIKVLPEHVAADLESKQRFEREAKTVASLSHPHICPIFDVGEQDGIHFLVMEYLDGETLAQRLRSGALSLPQGLRYASEIADALDKAHRRGIVHRDLKPSNIMLTATGAKLLDFGLAKLALPGTTGDVALAAHNTAGEPLTGQGSLVGTLPYMAPEQVQGRETDSRTDLFAFGAVLYEMVTGERAFDADGQANLIAAILKDDVPPVSGRQPLAPPALDGAIQRCLAKDREDRWQSAGDLRYEIQRIATEVSQETSASNRRTDVARDRRRERGWWAASVLTVGIVAGVFAIASLRRVPPANPTQAVKFAVTLPDGLRLRPDKSVIPFAVAPGGERIVLSAVDTKDISRLYARELRDVEIRALPGTEGGFGPFFSPDGTWVGFAASGALRKVRLNGGPVLTIAEKVVDEQFSGATWGPDDTIVFAPTRSAGLSQVPATGGIPRTLTAPDGDKGEVSHFLPEFLPGGRTVLFTMRAGLAAAPSRIEVLSLETRERRVIAEHGSNAHYAPTGHVVFAGEGLLEGSLWAIPFDARTLRVTGSEARVLDSLRSIAGIGGFTMAGSGTLAYLPRGERAPEELVWVDGSGADVTLTETTGNVMFPRLSPDRKRLAVTIHRRDDLRSGIWILDLDRARVPVLFSSQSRNDHLPVWTPDGTRVVFSSLHDANRDGAANLYLKRIDDSGDAERLTHSPHHQDPGSWSPDGKLLAFAEEHQETRWDVWLLDMSSRTPRPLIRTPARERYPMISPDGRWLAYTSNETGQEEVYVQAFPDGGQKQRISSGGGSEPLWARDQRRLFYRRTDDVVAVTVSSAQTLAIGPAEVLASGPYEGASGNGAPNYEVSADGRRFLMVRHNDVGSASETRFEVIANWFVEHNARLRTP